MRWRTRRLPSCHQPWVRPVSSRSRFGSVKKIWQETAKTSGSPKPSSRGARKSAATRMSLFSRTTMSFVAARTPALQPPPKPRFSGRARTPTSGKLARRKSALPSVEPLSTTRIWLAGLPASAVRMLGMYLASRSFPFQLGMTTVAAVLPAWRVGGACFSLPGRVKSCTRMRARKLIAISNGESNSSGSARMRRFRKAMSERGAEAYLAPQLDPSGGAHHGEQVFELAFLLLQPERPDRALLQIFFGLLQGGGGFGQRIGDVTDFGAEAGFDVEGPLGFFAAFLLQGGNLGVVCGDDCARVFLMAGECLLKLVDARSAGGERGV